MARILRKPIEPFLDSLENSMVRAGESLEKAILVGLPTADITGRFNDYISAINDFYELRIEEEQDAGRLTFSVRQELDRARADALNEARLLYSETPTITTGTILSRQRDARATAERTGTDSDYTESIARAQYDEEFGSGTYDAEVAGSLTSVLESVNEDVAVGINASITAIETQIAQASEPAEIVALLEQIPELIRTKYQRLRAALEAQFTAGELTLDAYNASLSELQSNESRELEQHSDAVLANTLRAINEDVQLIDASISSIQTQIAGMSEPEAIESDS